jgi:hypothetical protein
VNWLGRIAGATLAALSVGSCLKPERATKIAELRFPVAVLFGNGSMLLGQQPGQLTNMHTNYIILNSETPLLIDADFKINSLDHFRSVHGGLWLMAHPSGATDVTFELKPQKSGRKEAHKLFAHQLQKQTWRQDFESKRQALSRSQSLLEMAHTVQPTSD